MRVSPTALISSGVLGAGSGAIGGAYGAGEGNRLLGGVAGGLAGIPSGVAGLFLGGNAANAINDKLPRSSMINAGLLGSAMGGGAGGYAAGKGVKALKEGSMSPINYAFDIGKQRALKEAGYDSVEEVIKEAQALGLYEEPSKTAAAVDTNALAELRTRLGPALLALLASGALGGLSGAAGGALGAGEGNRLSGAGAGALAGIPTGIGGGMSGLLLQKAMDNGRGPGPGPSGGIAGSLLGGGAGGYTAGKGVKAIKESSMSPINHAFDIGKQKALKEAGYNSAEEVIKEAQALGLYEQPTEPSKTAAAVDTNALAELRARLK